MKLLNNKKYEIPILIFFIFGMFYKPLICVLILGFLATIIGIDTWFFIINIQKKGIESVGRILYYESDEDSHKVPIIEFKTKNGHQIKEKPYYYASTDLSIIRTYKEKLNKSVSVLYDKNKPEKFVILNEKGFNYFSLIFVILVGIVFLTIGTLSLLNIIQIDF
ncbi:hypothetical protein DS884_02800 [Tenacibaculum sp. E3R01]|uniref:DUF3592 domain-containing protein n=1 Tax=Tenacibaculum sp. E3R01 TaxID=2267227 RepID=UPI000DEBBD47|nr:hypothetical protein DS884_02800 [Tenacibaculum sp. E3R01]